MNVHLEVVRAVTVRYDALLEGGEIHPVLHHPQDVDNRPRQVSLGI
jgi:hypothetical protein